MFLNLPFPSSMTKGACSTETTLYNVVAPRLENICAISGSRFISSGRIAFQVPKLFLSIFKNALRKRKKYQNLSVLQIFFLLKHAKNMIIKHS